MVDSASELLKRMETPGWHGVGARKPRSSMAHCRREGTRISGTFVYLNPSRLFSVSGSRKRPGPP